MKRELTEQEYEEIYRATPGDEGYYQIPNSSAERSTRAANKLIVAERRAKVAKLVHARVPQYEIATLLRVSPGTVSYDVKWLKEQWRKEALMDTAEQIERELTELAVWEARLADEAGLPENKKTIPLYVDRILKIKDQRAKLLGLYAPTKVAQTNPDGTKAYAGMTEAEIDARIDELLKKTGVDNA